jgi:hypothetical protein
MQMLEPIGRSLLHPGLRRKSAERALKLSVPERWFGPPGPARRRCARPLRRHPSRPVSGQCARGDLRPAPSRRRRMAAQGRQG